MAKNHSKDKKHDKKAKKKAEKAKAEPGKKGKKPKKGDKSKKLKKPKTSDACIELKFCTCCSKHCPLTNPKCSKGKKVAVKLGIH